MADLKNSKVKSFTPSPPKNNTPKVYFGTWLDGFQ